jgi:hypothetical protein
MLRKEKMGKNSETENNWKVFRIKEGWYSFSSEILESSPQIVIKEGDAWFSSGGLRLASMWIVRSIFLRLG